MHRERRRKHKVSTTINMTSSGNLLLLSFLLIVYNGGINNNYKTSRNGRTTITDSALTFITTIFTVSTVAIASTTAASTIGFTEPNAISIKPDYGITNVTAQIGTNAYLPCKVKLVFNKSVSWVRVRDDHILTVDRITFIADERFHAFYAAETTGLHQQQQSRIESRHNPTSPHHLDNGSQTNDASSTASANSAAAGPWTLQIKYVQARDAGLYECQISTEPKISARVYLHVVVPKTESIGDTNRYVKEGSRVALHCVISGAIDPPLYVIWYHGQQQIFPDNSRHWKTEITHQDHSAMVKSDDTDDDGNQLENGALSLTEANQKKTIGSLIIPAIKKKDSGNYTCNPSNSPSLTILLNVINGEYSASAITSSSSSGCDYQQKTFNRFLNILCFCITIIALLIIT